MQKSTLTNSPEVWNAYWAKAPGDDLDAAVRGNEYYRLFRKLAGDFFSSGRKLRLLEDGCGSGICSLAAAREFPDAVGELVLADYSDAALALAGRTAGAHGLSGRTLLRKCDARALPFEDASFDLVWNEGVNEHFSGAERQKVFDEMFRVAKPGGAVCVLVPNKLNVFFMLRKSWLEAAGKWEFGFEDPFTPGELRGRMLRNRCRIVRAAGDRIAAEAVTSLQIVCPFFNGGLAGKAAGAARRVLAALDLLLVPALGGLLGRNIGVWAVKE